MSIHATIGCNSLRSALRPSHYFSTNIFVCKLYIIFFLKKLKKVLQFEKRYAIIGTIIVILLSAESQPSQILFYYENTHRGIKMKSSKAIVSEVSALCEKVALELGYTVWDVEYEKVGAEYHLTITIDSPSGIGIEDCEKMSRAIDPILDEADPIQGEYHLDVSSPGIEREIKNDFHLSSCIGETVIAKLYAPIDGQKSIVGVLDSFDSENVTLVAQEKTVIPRKAIAKMNIYFEF